MRIKILLDKWLFWFSGEVLSCSRAAGGGDNLIWWQCWYLGWCWPQWCWQSWQRARCHCLLTVDGIIQVLTIPTLLTLHHITTIHYPHLLLTSKIRYTLATFGHLTRQEVFVQPRQSECRYFISFSTYSNIHKYDLNMNRMGGEYLGLTMKYLFGRETAHLM